MSPDIPVGTHEVSARESLIRRGSSGFRSKSSQKCSENGQKKRLKMAQKWLNQ